MNERFSGLFGFVLIAAVIVGCSSRRHAVGPVVGVDGGSTDAAAVDSASVDAGLADARVDGAVDAGVDAAVADGGGVPQGYVADPVTMGLNLPARLPVLRIDVGGQTIQKDVDVAGTLEVFESHDGTLADLDTLTPTLSAPIAFQGRGNYTWSLPKKGYAFELQDGAGNGRDLAMLGLPAGSDFALYACYSDKTCMRNALVYALGQQLGRWSPRTRYVELFIDGNYQGLYMVWERIRRDVTRCDVPKPAASTTLGDITGGYIFRVEAGKGGNRDFTTTSGRIYTYHYPDADVITAEQSMYLRNSVQAFEDNMQATPAAYATWIEEASWVDRGVVEELTNNWDGYVHSIYMTKQPDSGGGLFTMGPLWDFDLAFANGNVTGYNCRTDNWAHEIVRPAPDDVPFYWHALYANADFQHAFKCRWQALRTGPITLATFDAQMAAWSAFTAGARARDQARWNTVGMMIFPNCFSRPTYDGEVTALHDWIAARLTWLDTQVAAMPGSCP